MALSILDGNQTATTLSTVVSAGAHIPAHTVVSLGSQAITDMRSAVSGSVVSISNLPATQTVAGTVTASAVGKSNTNDGTLYPIPVCESGNNDYLGRHIPIGFKNSNSESTLVDNNNPLPIAGTVTANVFENVFIRVYPTGNDWNGGILERVSQTRWQDHAGSSIEYNEQNAQWEARYVDGNALYATNTDNQFAIPPLTGWGVIIGDNFTISYEKYATQTIAGTVTANVANSLTIGSLPAISGTVTANVTNSVTVGSLPVQLSTTTIAGTARLNVTLSSATTVGGAAPSYANLYGGSDGTNLRAISVDTSGRTVVTGSLTVSQSGTTTIGALPSGALTTRFGSVTTANLAQISTAVTNTSRKYLLAQNISSGTVTIGIGFSPTTTQGIQLTAGAGITFDTFCPTGAVYWLGATTGATFTILEG